MKKSILTLLAFASQITFAQLSADSIKAIIKQEVANKRSKSIVVGIIDKNGRQIYSEGVVSDENPVLPDGNTVYEIGSITKVFTSLLLADMSLKHEVNLNDPISKFLPKNVKSPTRNGKEITLSNLSTHRGTFPRFPYNVDPKNLDEPYADYSVKRLYEYVSDFKPGFDIDSRWQYSNVGYGVLGEILTSVAYQKNYETFVEDVICKPLGMKSTVITFTPEIKKRTAIGHSEYGEPADFIELGAIEACGGFRSTANDMLTFAAANLGFIKSDIYPAMELTHLKQAKKDGNKGYATLGWTLYNDDGKYIIFKDGGTPGYRTFLGIDNKNGFAVVVLSNSNNGVTDIGNHIIDSTSKIMPYKYPWKLLDTLRTTVNQSGVASGIDLYKRLKSSKKSDLYFNENQLNYLGHELRKASKINDAIKIFELNAAEYPNSTLPYESLGEIYKRNNNKKKAIECFRKAQQLEPENPRWKFLLDKLIK
ncbi:serine hydrolase [Epilithonimonas sp.]|uniref:serine hydrolase n=1 Tax=Epilithonimonas sp. TaxID=2894511 RepID=UPI00289DD5DD|nr:serine hydrolase [Epilithonimonas sp.]